MLPSLVWSNAGEWNVGGNEPACRTDAAPTWTKRARKQGRVHAPPVRDFEGVVAHHAAQLRNLICYRRLRAAEAEWAGAPRGVDPADGLPAARAPRKRQQIQFLCRAVSSLARDGDVIVDFCSGSGHVGIPLAHLLPRCTVVLVDMNAVSIDIARRRVRAAGLSNVRVVEARVQGAFPPRPNARVAANAPTWNRPTAAEFGEPFDIGVGLHACGEVGVARRLRFGSAQGCVLTGPARRQTFRSRAAWVQAPRSSCVPAALARSSTAAWSTRGPAQPSSHAHQPFTRVTPLADAHCPCAPAFRPGRRLCGSP